MGDKIELITSILRIKRYCTIALVSGAGLGTVYYFLTMSMFADHIGVIPSVSNVAVSVGLTIVISALAGINFAIMAYKISRARMAGSIKSNSSAVFGGAFAAFTPGCPACTAPLAVILGAVGGLSLFPMGGLELKFVSAGVLTFSIYWMARGLQNRSCCRVL